MLKLSVIIPTLNEMKLSYLPNILEGLSRFDGVEIIVSDGKSSDETLEIAKKFGAKIISSTGPSRSQRLNAGMRVAKAEMFLLHHPRSMVEPKGIEYILRNYDSLLWGGLTHSFDFKHPLLQFTSWYSNNVRGKLSGIVYLDHCIFLRKSIYEKIGEFPNVDIFEDTILSKKILKYFGRPKIIPYFSTTSAIRFKQNGIYKQAILNQFLKISFLAGKNHKEMNRLYEKNLSLNSQYDKNLAK
jgi:glycosyltransferase involved in cell wall biosynthesis